MTIEFMTHWFEENAKDEWDTHLFPALDIPIEAYLEVGLGEGHSMRWVLENMKPERAVAIDPYIPKRKKETEHYAKLRQNALAQLKPWIDKKTLNIITQKSQDVLRIFCHAYAHIIPDNGFDLIYCDGDHRCLPTLVDCVLAWPKLKVGGIMIMDDYDRRYQRGWPMSREGIDAFLVGAEKHYDLVWGEPHKRDITHVAIRKTEDW